MSAKDYFQLVKRHISEGLQYARQIAGAGLTGHENLKYFQKLDDSFNRLFTPRPLKELFDQGFRHCMVWNPATLDIHPRYMDLRGNATSDFVGNWRLRLNCVPYYLATPVLTPKDMGFLSEDMGIE